MRKTVYGIKAGMTQIFEEQGILTPVTVIKIVDNHIVRTYNDIHGNKKFLLGVSDIREKLTTKAHRGQFSDKAPIKRHLFEVPAFDDSQKAGAMISASVFSEVSFVDVQGCSKGKGTQGVMKRHNSAGGPGRVGSKFRRTAGSTGQSATPSRVRKGTHMAGRMGNSMVSVQNARVVSVDTEQNVLVVKGGVPGSVGTMVRVSESIKKKVIV